MNYIEQIRGLWQLNEEHAFSTTELALYLYLLEVCNSCGWKNPFRRNNIKVQADLSISYNTLKNARRKLQACGLLSFTTTNGKPNVEYTLSPLSIFGHLRGEQAEGEPLASPSANQSEGSPLGADQAQKPAAKRKPKAATPFVKPTLQEVKAYCEERKNSVDAERFISYYQANGWRVGKNEMKDWRAAVRTWEQNAYGRKRQPSPLHTGTLETNDDRW